MLADWCKFAESLGEFGGRPKWPVFTNGSGDVAGLRVGMLLVWCVMQTDALSLVRYWSGGKGPGLERVMWLLRRVAGVKTPVEFTRIAARCYSGTCFEN